MAESTSLWWERCAAAAAGLALIVGLASSTMSCNGEDLTFSGTFPTATPPMTPTGTPQATPTPF